MKVFQLKNNTPIMLKKIIISFAVLISISIFYLFYIKQDDDSQQISFLLDWKMTSFYSPYLLAEAKGYYKQEGLDIQILEGQGAETTAKLVGQNKYQIGSCNAAATAISVDHNIPVVSIAVLEQDAVTAIFSLKDSNIQFPKDLIGKTLGVRYYDISHKEYIAMMNAMNIPTQQVKEVSVGWELQPLLTGQVDALYNYAYNMPIVLKLQGKSINTILVKDNGVNGYGSNLIVNKEFAKNNKDAIKGFIRASRRAWEDTIKNPEEAIAILKNKYPEIDERIALYTLKEQLHWLNNSKGIFSQSRERWDNVLSTYKSLNMISDKINSSDVFTNEYQDEIEE